jgi:hypothetical protein
MEKKRKKTEITNMEKNSKDPIPNKTNLLAYLKELLD